MTRVPFIDVRHIMLAATALVLAVAGDARAQDHAARVVLIGCAAELGLAVEPALAVELSNVSADARRALDTGDLHCELVCDGPSVTAVVARGSSRVEQSIEASGSVLARRVALVLAELIEASSGPVLDALAPEAPEPVTPASATSAPPQAFRSRVRIAGGPWIGADRVVALLALEIGVELAPTDNIALVIGAAGTLGAVDVDRAHLDLRMISATASLRIGGAFDAFWLGGGPAVRGGAVLWTGTPREPTLGSGRDTVGGWLGLGAVIAVFVRLLDSPLRAGLEIEGGGIAIGHGALVYGALAESIGGGWVEVRLAVDVTL